MSATTLLVPRAADTLLPAVAAAVLTCMFLIAALWEAPHILTANGPDVVDTANDSGDLLRQASFLLLFAGMTATAVYTGSARVLLAVPTFLLPALAWSWLSLLWAIDPSIAFRRLVFSTVVIVTLSTCVAAMPPRRAIETLLLALSLIVLLDWAAVLLFRNAIQQDWEVDPSVIGAWRGLQPAKNGAGAIAAVCMIASFTEMRRLRSWLSGLLLTVLAAVFLYQSRSKTSGGFVLFALLGGYLVAASYRHPGLRKAVYAALLLAAAWVAPFLSDIGDKLSPMLDDPTAFTGRTQIWSALVSYASDNILLGSGYGSFWALGQNGPWLRYGGGWLDGIFEAHNGYLDLLVQTGAPGLTIAVACFLLWPLRHLLTAEIADERFRPVMGALVIFGGLQNLLETSLYDRANEVWMAMVVAYCLISPRRNLQRKEAADDHTQHAPAPA